MTEQDIQSSIFEMPDRIWTALKFSIEENILTLERALINTADQIILCQYTGGIFYLRNLLDELSKHRIELDDSVRIQKANYTPRGINNLSLPRNDN